jgi:hypothetical protein
MQFWRTPKQLLLLLLLLLFIKQVFTDIYEHEVNKLYSNWRKQTITLHKDIIRFKRNFRIILYFRSASDLITNESLHKVFQIKVADINMLNS